MENLKDTLKKQIVEYLNLDDYTPDQIQNDEPLFGGRLGLDSIDSLELVVLLEREYGLKIKNPSEGKHILNNVDSMAHFIESNKK